MPTTNLVNVTPVLPRIIQALPQDVHYHSILLAVTNSYVNPLNFLTSSSVITGSALLLDPGVPKAWP